MVNVLVAYATPDLDDGVLPRLLAWIQDRGFDPLPVRIGKDKLLDWIPFDQAVVAVSLAEGVHQEAFARFVRDHRATLEDKPSLFLSLEDPSLPAEEQGPGREAYVLEELELATGWRPSQAWMLDAVDASAAAVASKPALDAPYRASGRFLMPARRRERGEIKKREAEPPGSEASPERLP